MALKERLPEEFNYGLEKPDPWMKKPIEPMPEPEPEEEVDPDPEEERLRVEVAKLEDERDTLQKQLKKKQRGKIKGINARNLFYQLAFHLEQGEVWIDIVHDGGTFLTVQESDINPLKDLMHGLIPKVGNGDGTDKITYKQNGPKELQETNKAEGSPVFNQKE